MNWFRFLALLMFIGIGSVSDSQAAESCDFYFKKLKLCAHLQWVVQPQSVEMISEKDKAELNLRFFKKETPTIESDPQGDLTVKLWMPSMGHGSRPTEVQKLKPGLFHVTNLYFTMEGEWEIRVEIKKNQKVSDKAAYSYHL